MKEKTQVVSRVPVGLKRQAVKAAAKRRISLNALVTEALAAYLAAPAPRSVEAKERS